MCDVLNSIQTNVANDQHDKGVNDPFLLNLAEWQALKRAKIAIDKRESELRALIAEGVAGPNPAPGTKNHELPDGRIVKVATNLYRSVDMAAAESACRRLREDIGTKVDDLFPVKRSFSATVYKTLTPEQQEVADEAITTKPGKPEVSVV